MDRRRESYYRGLFVAGVVYDSVLGIIFLFFGVGHSVSSTSRRSTRKGGSST